MDIALGFDLSVKRINHGMILSVVDSGSNRLYNYSENGILVNNIEIKEDTELKDRDIIKIGDSSFVFIEAYDIWK